MKNIVSLGVNATIMLEAIGEIYKEERKAKRIDDEGYFYLAVDKVKEISTLSPYKQIKAIKVLEEKNYVSVAYKGMPPCRKIKLIKEG